MIIKPSSKLFKSKLPKSTKASLSDDDLLFSHSELKQMHRDDRRSTILKIAIPCLLVAILGMIVYTVGGSLWSSYNASVIKQQTENQQKLQQQQRQASATAAEAQQQVAVQAQQKQQQQCQYLEQKLATDQESLSSDQQALILAEQSLPTKGPLTVQATLNLISADQNLIASTQELVNQDQDFISQWGCR